MSGIHRWPDLPAIECWSERDPNVDPPDFRVADVAAAESCLVYCEVLPGGTVGEHTDSAEEVVVVIEGVLDAWAGDRRTTLQKGDLLVIPAMQPHGLANRGREPARFVGVFVEPRVVNTFAKPLMPFNERVLETPSPPPS
ncbi:MAG TPA: cupin domain-containing protein [Candidatus Thermoplasmatota archaeon]|nr:cupin domain-containing protein [Candidatus Thermoplasmatota archaeon]